jgi:hypothetical protein
VWQIDNDTVLTGGSDGILRLVGIQPNRLLGVVGEHGGMPVECIRINNQRNVMATSSHDMAIHLWDARPFFDNDNDNDNNDHVDNTATTTSLSSSSSSSLSSPSSMGKSEMNSSSNVRSGVPRATTTATGEVLSSERRATLVAQIKARQAAARAKKAANGGASDTDSSNEDNDSDDDNDDRPHQKDNDDGDLTPSTPAISSSASSSSSSTTRRINNTETPRAAAASIVTATTQTPTSPTVTPTPTPVTAATTIIGRTGVIPGVEDRQVMATGKRARKRKGQAAPTKVSFFADL